MQRLGAWEALEARPTSLVAPGHEQRQPRRQRVGTVVRIQRDIAYFHGLSDPKLVNHDLLALVHFAEHVTCVIADDMCDD